MRARFSPALLVGLVTIGLALAIGQVLTIRTPVPPADPPRAAQPASGPSLPRYELVAAVDYDAATVDVSQRVVFRNQTGALLDRLVFQVPPAAVGAFRLKSVRLAGQPTNAELDGSVLELTPSPPLAAGGWADVALEFRLELPRGTGRSSAGPRVLALGNWLPTLAVHHGGWDRHQYTEIGDPFVADVASFDLALTINRPLELATSGQVVGGGGTRFHVTAQSARDLSVALSPDYRPVERTADTVVVRAFGLDDARSVAFADAAARFLRWYSAQLGPYPYPTLTVAEADLPPAWIGMEYPGMIFVSTAVPLEQPFQASVGEALIGHELAHQWFYGLVGTDQVASPWLDESFAQLLPYLYYRSALPDEADQIWQSRVLAGLDQQVEQAGRLPLDSSIYDFADNGAYYVTVYQQGARFLDELRQTMGDAAFMAGLRAEVDRFADRRATPLAVLDLYQRQTAVNLNPLLARYFTYPAVHDAAPLSWELELPAGPWRQGDLLGVRADRPIADLEVWLDDRLIARGPATPLRLDLADVEPGGYLALVRLVDQRGAVYERAERVNVMASGRLGP